MSAAFQDRVVFILGSARSGTTWLGQLLQAHPRVVGLDEGETRMFVALRPLLHNEALASLTGAYAVTAAVRTFADGLFAAARDSTRPGATHFVEKTPAHAREIPEILRVFPHAWFVHLVRDPRAVARSLSELEFGESNIRRGAESWSQVQGTIRRETRDVERYRMVRYEDLVADPEAITCELFTWLGLPTGEDVRTALAERVGVRVAQFAEHRLRPQPTKLDDTEIVTVLMRAGPMMVKLGYATEEQVAQARGSPEAERIKRSLRWRRSGTS